MFDTLSVSLSTTTDSIHLCIKDTAELQLSVERLLDDKGMGIAQLKAQLKTSKHDIDGVNQKAEQAVESNKSLNEGNLNLRARVAALEKTVSNISKKQRFFTGHNSIGSAKVYRRNRSLCYR
jgi:regulator of replication initiation timing